MSSWKITSLPTTKYVFLGFLVLLISVGQEINGMPWWSPHDASYDASLDPLVWSRAFVQDSVRRPRTNPIRKTHFNAPHISYINEGRRRRKSQTTTAWWYHLPQQPQQPSSKPVEHFFDDSNYNRYMRRRHRAMERGQRYGLV